MTQTPPRKFRLLRDRLGHAAGTIVYLYDGYDYGLVRDDNAAFGVEHTAVTEDEDAGTPFFTVAISELEAVE